jgi:signal transduction histidine kinase
VIGMVTMRGERGMKLSPEQSDALQVLTVLAATAMECARLHDELARSTIVVARANRLASLGLLTAGLAHEVRNPLAALRTFAQLLPERWDNAEFRREFASVVLSEIDRMHLLMNDVLRFARRGPEPDEAGNLAEIVASIVPLLKVQADKKGVELLFVQETEAPQVAAEVAAVRQVTMNLVLNAIDATPVGGRIRIGCAGQCDAGRRRGILRVSDSGPGIAPEHLPLIFEPFFTTRTEGTGLGLAITHQIVRDHGGTIDVQSSPGAGTTFRVELPAAESGAPVAVAGTARVGGAIS